MRYAGFRKDAGDPWTICQRCGWKYAMSETVVEWSGLRVCLDCEDKEPTWGTPKDDPTPTGANSDNNASNTSTTLSSAASKYDTTITLTSVANIIIGSSVGVVLDSGDTHWSFATAAPSGSDVTINEYLPGDAASGNTVYIPGGGETYITNKTASTRKANL